MTWKKMAISVQRMQSARPIALFRESTPMGPYARPTNAVGRRPAHEPLRQRRRSELTDVNPLPVRGGPLYRGVERCLIR